MLWLIIGAAVGVAQSGIEAESQKQRRIVVAGYGSVETPPNVAQLSYNVRGEGSSSDDAVRSLVAKSNAIESALASMDAQLKLQSESARVQAVRGGDCEESDYEDKIRLSAGECAIVGYRATQDFDVYTKKVKDAATMIGLASRHGATSPKVEGFNLEDRSDARRRAIAAAMADARTKAQAIADASGARLGETLSISLDGARLSDDAYDIVVTGSRMIAGERDEPIPIKIEPAPVETSATVTVSYAIGR